MGVLEGIKRFMGKVDPSKSMNEAGIKRLLSYGLNGARIEDMPSTKADLLAGAQADKGIIPFSGVTRSPDNHRKMVAYLKLQTLSEILQNIKENAPDERKEKIQRSIDVYNDTILLPAIKMMNALSYPKDINDPDVITMQVPVMVNWNGQGGFVNPGAKAPVTSRPPGADPLPAILPE